MDIDDLDATAIGHLYRLQGVTATVQHQGELSHERTVLLDRAAPVFENNTIVERRCEICLLISTTGAGDRGTTVDTGKPDDRWRLAESISNDGLEARWVAVRDRG